jgi:hypothetical protein
MFDLASAVQSSSTAPVSRTASLTSPWPLAGTVLRAGKDTDTVTVAGRRGQSGSNE